MDLPVEILVDIFTQCENKLMIMLTCKNFYYICRDICPAPRLCFWLYCKKLVDFKHDNILKWAIEHSDETDLQPSIIQSITQGDMNLFDYLIKCGSFNIDKVFKCAAKHNQIHVFEKLNWECQSIIKLSNIASKYGHLYLIKCLYDHGFDPLSLRYGTIIKYGRLDILQWFNANGGKLKPEMLYKAVEYNQFEIFKWLINEGCEICCINTYKTAKGKGDIFKWLYSRGFDFDKEDSLICAQIAKYGNLELLKQAHERGFVISENAVNAAAKCGHLEVLQWIHNNIENCINEIVLSNATHYGHLNIVKWYYKCGYPREKDVYKNATANGHFDIVKWLHKKNLIDQSELRVYTSINIENLKWMRENGYTWGKQTFYTVCKTGDVKCLKYAIENSSIELLTYIEVNSSMVYRFIISAGNVDCLTYMYEKGYKCPNTKSFIDCLPIGRERDWTRLVKNFEMVKWLHAHGIILSYKHAYKYGNADKIAWLIEHGYEVENF